jgi:hypothetical protein
MNNTTLLAFLYAIATENVQDPIFKRLAIQLKCKPIDWKAVQEKLDQIFNTHPKLQQAYTNYKTQLDTKKSLLDLLLPIPEKLKLNKAPLTRSAKPGLPDQETIEITNIAVVILQSDNPPEMSKRLLKQELNPSKARK